MNWTQKKNHIDDMYDKNQIQKKATDEQMDLLYKNLFISVPSSFLCAIIVFIALIRIPHTNLLLFWLVAMFLISLCRILHIIRYMRDNKSTPTRFYTFLVLTALSAAIWSLAGSVLMPNNYPIEQMIVIVVLAGVTTGGVQSLQPSLIASFIYTNLLILPLAGWIFFQGTVAYSILGLSVVLYLLFNLAISIRGYKFLRHTLKLKYVNLDLANHLVHKNQQLTEVNQEIQEKENNLRLIHDNAPIGMAVVSIDGRWLNVNNKLCEIVGYSRDELEALTIQDITYPEDLDKDLENKNKLLSGKLNSYQIEKRYVNKNHQLIWIVTNVSLVRNKKYEPLYYISQIEDINDRKQNEATMAGLSKMNAMLQLCRDSTEAYSIISHTAGEIFSGFSGGLAVFNKATDSQVTVGSWGKHPILQRSFKSEDCWAFRSGNVYFAKDPDEDALCNHFNQKPLSSYICLPLLVQGQLLGMLNFTTLPGQVISHYQEQVIKNFSEIVKLSLSNIQLKEALSDQAIHDPLTGLLNRRYLYSYLPNLLYDTINNQQIFSVCMLDIDYFKKINDEYGHDAGDEILTTIGQILKSNLRETDITCRYGGEEFVLILIGSDLKYAKSRMEQIKKAIANAKIIFQNKVLPSIAVSVGISEAPKQGDTVVKIIRAADLALYVAKNTGRNKIVLFEPSMLKEQH